jgi:hypothetical protein
MARETSYFVQAFNAGKGGKLKADAPIVCKSAPGAVRTAERLALSKLGVVAFASTGDPEMGDYDDEPTVIFRTASFPPPSTDIFVPTSDVEPPTKSIECLLRVNRVTLTLRRPLPVYP